MFAMDEAAGGTFKVPVSSTYPKYAFSPRSIDALFKAKMAQKAHGMCLPRVAFRC
jgi:hypothetical protein